MFDTNPAGNRPSMLTVPDSVQQAGEMALKMYMNSQSSGGSSGASGLMVCGPHC